MADQAAQRVERFIKERRATNEILVSWPLYYFVLSWLTLGIYPIVVWWKRVARADAFRDRKEAYYNALIEYTSQRAEGAGRLDAVHNELADLSGEVKVAFNDRMRPINPGLSLALTIVTLGVWGLVVVYKLDRFWVEIQRTEQDFDDALSQLWTKLGLIRYPIRFDVDRSVERSFGLYLVSTILTLGIFGIVWDYKVHTDPERLYKEFDSTEDAVLAAIRQAG